jgi:hypothetical protein
MASILKKAIQRLRSNFMGLPTDEENVKELTEGINYLIDAASAFSYEYKDKRQEIMEELCRIRQLQIYISVYEFTTIAGGMKELNACLNRLEKIA